MNNLKKDLNNNSASEENKFEIQSSIFDKITAEDLVRGVAPSNIESRCLELCKAFISGSWSNATTNDVNVKRISGGLTNQLWHVKLNDNIPRVPNNVYNNEPNEVAIKLFQKKHMKNYHEDDHERLNDIIILTIMAEANIGPKIYGIFDDGFIQVYHEHEQFRAKHQENEKLLDEVIGLLAKIHHSKIPIRKSKNLLFDDIGKMIQTAYDNFPINEICINAGYKNMLERDLTIEWEIVKRIIDKLNAPIVFCHCDFRGSNLLVTEQGIVCVDLEYSNYGSRPYDISTFLNEWGKVNLFDRNIGKIPNDKVIMNFIRIYIDHCERLKPGYASKPENQPEVIYKEIRVFFLVTYMFILSIMVKTEESIIPNIPFDRVEFLGHCNQIYGYYKIIKQNLLNEGMIDQEDL